MHGQTLNNSKTNKIEIVSAMIYKPKLEKLLRNPRAIQGNYKPTNDLKISKRFQRNMQQGFFFCIIIISRNNHFAEADSKLC